jgi:hypothetical protein
MEAWQADCPSPGQSRLLMSDQEIRAFWKLRRRPMRQKGNESHGKWFLENPGDFWRFDEVISTAPGFRAVQVRRSSDGLVGKLGMSRRIRAPGRFSDRGFFRCVILSQFDEAHAEPRCSVKLQLRVGAFRIDCEFGKAFCVGPVPTGRRNEPNRKCSGR